MGYSPRGHKELGMTERLHFHFHDFFLIHFITAFFFLSSLAKNLVCFLWVSLRSSSSVNTCDFGVPIEEDGLRIFLIGHLDSDPGVQLSLKFALTVVIQIFNFH